MLRETRWRPRLSCTVKARVRVLLLGVVILSAPLWSGCIPTSGLVTSQIPVDATRRALRAVLPTATETPTPVPATQTVTPTRTPRPGRSLARVLRAWDGNTILIEGGYTVRYIGVDTPGAGMFRRPVEPFGREAAERNSELVEGADIDLEDDASDVDSAGNLLRYVYVDDIMVNELLLREGLARLAPVGRNSRHDAILQAAEADARAEIINIWTLVTPTPTLSRTPAPTLRPSWTPLPTRTPLPTPVGLPRAPAILVPPPTSGPSPTPTGSGTPDAFVTGTPGSTPPGVLGATVGTAPGGAATTPVR